MTGVANIAGRSPVAAESREPASFSAFSGDRAADFGSLLEILGAPGDDRPADQGAGDDAAAAKTAGGKPIAGSKLAAGLFRLKDAETFDAGGAGPAEGKAESEPVQRISLVDPGDESNAAAEDVPSPTKKEPLPVRPSPAGATMPSVPRKERDEAAAAPLPSPVAVTIRDKARGAVPSPRNGIAPLADTSARENKDDAERPAEDAVAVRPAIAPPAAKAPEAKAGSATPGSHPRSRTPVSDAAAKTVGDQRELAERHEISGPVGDQALATAPERADQTGAEPVTESAGVALAAALAMATAPPGAKDGAIAGVAVDTAPVSRTPADPVEAAVDTERPPRMQATVLAQSTHFAPVRALPPYIAAATQPAKATAPPDAGAPPAEPLPPVRGGMPEIATARLPPAEIGPLHPEAPPGELGASGPLVRPKEPIAEIGGGVTAPAARASEGFVDPPRRSRDAVADASGRDSFEVEPATTASVDAKSAEPPSALPPSQVQRLAGAIVSAAANTPPVDPSGSAADAGDRDKPVPAGPLRTLSLQLEPVALGVVTVTLRLAGSELSLRVRTEHEATARLIRDDHDAIADMLRQSGYEPEIVGIDSMRTEAAPVAAAGQPAPAGALASSRGESAAGATAGEERGASPERRSDGGRQESGEHGQREQAHETHSPDRRDRSLYV